MIISELQKTRDVINTILADDHMHDQIKWIVLKCANALFSGNKIIVCGNGGSAADAQHLAAELVGKLNFDRYPLAAISLTTDTSALTAIGNDYGFDQVFSRQLRAIGKRGDVLVVISTSGNSSNILKAIKAAREMDIVVIGMSGGDGGKMADACQIMLKIPSTETQKIQEGHIVVGHIICGMIEKKMFA